MDDRDPQRGQGRREPSAEGDDQEQAETHLMLRDGAEQHDESRRAWNESRRSAHRQKSPPGDSVRQVMVVPVSVSVRVVVPEAVLA